MARKARAQKKGTARFLGKQKNPATNNDGLKDLREWLFPDDGIFSRIKWHGNIKWTPLSLVWLALCWAWADTRNLTEAFHEGLTCCQKMFGSSPIRTYPGFIGALATWTSKLMSVLHGVVRERMEQIGGKYWRMDGWVPIAFDGSRSSTPRSLSNEAAFCASNYGNGKTAKYRKKKSKGMRRKRNEKNKPQPPKPQAWITMMWHMALRLPWNWRLGPSNSSERDHVVEMLQTEQYPKNTLFCGDAGFIGYPFWSSLLAKGNDFLVRVGANVTLLHKHANCTMGKKKKKEMQVLCWPKTVMQADQPPLRLRLVQVSLGKTLVWMLTSVLEHEKLSTKAIIRLYKMRWGIEVEFRGLKQTLDRAKLRSRNDRHLLAELNWSILAMAMAELLALKEQLTHRAEVSANKCRRADPAKRSLAKTMRALRECLRNLEATPKLGEDLVSRLRSALTDSYVRKALKRARYRPKNPDKKPLGDPKIHPLSELAKKKLRRLAA
jgi:Transposase DDE domain